MATRPVSSADLPRDAELLGRMLDSFPGGVVVVAADGAIQAANPTALHLLGLSYDTLTQRYAVDFAPDTFREDGTPYPVEEYPAVRAIVTGAAAGPATIGVRQADGSLAWAIFTAVPVRDRDGHVEAALVTMVDITDRKALEVARQEADALFRSVIDSSPNPIIVTDRAGTVIFASRAPPGLSTDLLLGRPAWSRIVGDDQVRAREAMLQVIADGQPRSLEVQGLTARWMCHVAPRRVGDRIEGATIITWDITAQRQLEASLATADRMASIGVLAAGLAHEINNPLTYLLASVEALLRRAEPPRDARDLGWLHAALEGTRRIRDIVADLGSFSRVAEGTPAPLEVTPLLDSAVRMASHEIRYRARVTRDFQPTPPVLATEGRLGQVFLNLVVNASQALPEDARAQHEIALSTRVDDAGRVVVEVADTGAGIAPELADRIFEPFVTSKPQGVGTGLGLYICRNVVESLGGRLEAMPRPGGGTIMRVTLPAAPVAAPPPRGVAAPSPSSRRRQVLAIDDEPAILRALAEILGDHDVTCVGGGAAGLAAIDAGGYDLILCDVVMPGVGGAEVYAHVRQRHPETLGRIVFMTGGAPIGAGHRFLDELARPILAKPFTSRDVLHLLESLAP